MDETPMDAPDVNEAGQKGRSMLRRLYKLTETQRWVHHAADLDSGKLVTTPLERPVTPLARVERFAELGLDLDPTVFGGPSYRLSPKKPYQPAPEAWFDASGPSYLAPQVDALYWELPPTFQNPHAFYGLDVSFPSSPIGRSVASLSLSGHAYENTQGHLYLSALGTGTSVYVPVGSSFGEHALDFTFVSSGSPIEIVVALLVGVKFMAFTGISFMPARPERAPG